MQAGALNFNYGVGRFDFYAEAAEAFERAGTILSSGIVAYFGGTFGQGGQNCIAMRDGFISRNFDGAIDFAGGID